MGHSVISSNGVTVEIKGKRVFINGKEISDDKMRGAAIARLYCMFYLVAGFLGGSFFAVVVLIFLKG